MKTLRPYQRAAVDALKEHLADNCALIMPTGGGKTFTIAVAVRELGLPTLWLAERRELVDQAAGALRDLELDVGIVLAGRPRYPGRVVQVASVQTLVRREFPQVKLIVIDECHHVPGERMRKLLGEYPGVPRIGATATPFRLDGAPLGEAFGRLIVAAYPDELVADGVLIEPRVYAPPAASLLSVRVRGGDYEKRGMNRAMDKPKLVGDIVRTWKQHASGLRTILFAAGVDHSRHLIAAFTAAGVHAEHLDGQTPIAQREASLRRLHRGQTLVLSNCQCLTEGFDLPALQCAIIARPTASLCLHIQMVGRICRSCPGKAGCVVLDHAGNFLRHGRVTRRIEYSLELPQPAAAETGLAVCPSCHRMVLATRENCPECGAILITTTGTGVSGGSREIPQSIEGELEEFDGHRDEMERARFMEEKRAEAAAKGYRPGWAAWRYMEQYGVMPPREAVLA